MNREILFRGKRVDNGEWIYGWYCEACYGLQQSIIPTGEARDGYWRAVEIDPSTVGQYTGLTDKTGKRIFEGDIVQHIDYPDEPCQIVWHETGFAIKGLWYEDNLKKYKGMIQVIGTVYDNPELLH